jgi:FlaA1/EpsC-like NDP-sugar epimerase
MQPIAFIDKNPSLHNTFLGGIKILAPHKLEKLALKKKVDEVLIAMPSASKGTLRSLLKDIEKYSVKVRILPGLAELAQGKVLVSELKGVDISDLLGRFEVEANQNLINRNIKDRVVLITGAGGSIGSEIARQVVKNKAKTVIILDSNEYSLYKIRNELESLPNKVELHTVLASVTNSKRIMAVCKNFKVDTIYHTAAYKHVPLVEENPFEGFINNILGTKICVEAAEASNVETFVLISTDKAVRPTNIMGATKRFAELILQSKAAEAQTRMIMVRFGNVIGSSGSAIPLFQQQIKSGGPVTVTHPEVVRYFMSIPEAAELVIQAGAMGKGGDVFVLDMGEPVKIYELAKRLIILVEWKLKMKIILKEI